MGYPNVLPIETDYAIFLFDHGETNLIGSMLKYVESTDTKMRDIQLRIIFMGLLLEK